MTKNEREVIINFAKGQVALRKEAIGIFLKYLGVGRCMDILEMRFMSEISNPCPDLALRSKYRKELLRDRPGTNS
jgi:hypothetical protein